MSEPQNGRIGGGVLKDNLLRQGNDLAFDTNLLYLKVDANTDTPSVTPSTPLEFDDGDPNYALGNRGIATKGIGINTDVVGAELTIAGTLSTTNLESTYVNFDRYSIATNQISLTSDNIILDSTNSIFATAIATDNLKIDFNTISTTTTDTNIELRPNGNGIVNINSNWNITGGLHATGNIQTSGNFTLGNDDEDNVSFAADVNSDIIPDQTNTSDLGSVSKQWLNMYSTLLNGEAVAIDELVVGAQAIQV